MPRRALSVLIAAMLGCAGRAPETVTPTPPVAPTAVTPAAVVVPQAPARQAENLRAFAKVYGYVRWFHPSDEASEVDWVALAVYGAKEVRHAADAAGLRATLERLFEPVAPTLRIYREGEAAPDMGRVRPADTTGLTTVAWQYIGPGGHSVALPYIGKRTDRVGYSASTFDSDPGLVSRSLEVEALRGKQVRVRSAARMWGAGQGDLGKLFLRVSGPGGQQSALGSRLVQRSAWSTLEFTVDVAADAEHVKLGCFLAGIGPLMLDDVEVAVRQADGSFTPLALANGGFEAGTEEWRVSAEQHEVAAVEAAARSGARGLRIRRREVERGPSPLFAKAATVGEAVDAAIGQGLRVQVPLALYSKDGRTLGGSPRLLNELRTALAADRSRREEAYASLLQPDLRAAAVIVAWNTLQHFYPYFDVVKVDWEAALTTALADSVTATDELGFVRALERMIAGLGDGHAYVTAPAVQQGLGRLPLEFVWVEGAVAVLASGAPEVQRGDVLERVNGLAVAEWLAELEGRSSGSPQRRKLVALHKGRSGPRGTTAKLELRRGAQAVTATLVYGDGLPEAAKGPAIERVKEGVYFIDLANLDNATLQAEMPRLIKAKGIVIDTRHGAMDATWLLSQLMSAPDERATHKILEVIRPDHVPADGVPEPWSYRPMEPRLTAKVAWLIDAGTQSYLETLTSTAEANRLGELVGSASSGANGDVRRVAVPGEITVTFTGMVVFRADGTPFHTIGVRPTVPQERTLAGIRAGRDEVRERGLAVVGGR